MKKLLTLALTCLVLAGCNEEQRAHERDMQERQYQHEQALERDRLTYRLEHDKLKIASDERSSKEWAKTIDGGLKVALVIGGLVTVCYIIGWVADRRNAHIASVHFKEHEERTRRYEVLVAHIMDPNNGLSEPSRVKAIEAAASAATPQSEGPQLPYYGNEG